MNRKDISALVFRISSACVALEATLEFYKLALTEGEQPVLEAVCNLSEEYRTWLEERLRQTIENQEDVSQWPFDLSDKFYYGMSLFNGDSCIAYEVPREWVREVFATLIKARHRAA